MTWRLLGLVAILSGCGWYEDSAGGVAGPAVVVHCDNLARGDLTPGSVGDSTTKVNCPGATEATELPSPAYEAQRR